MSRLFQSKNRRNVATSPALLLLGILTSIAGHAQTSTVTNSAAPTSSVSATTTGGTNINYQTNNQWDNQVGFGPGIICRTPVLFAQGSNGTNNGYLNGSGAVSTSNSDNYSASVGLLIPFGSSSLPDCEKLARQILTDRQISTQLSLIRACAQLEKEGIKVDPIKYPLLSNCVSQTATIGPQPTGSFNPATKFSGRLQRAPQSLHK